MCVCVCARASVLRTHVYTCIVCTYIVLVCACCVCVCVCVCVRACGAHCVRVLGEWRVRASTNKGRPRDVIVASLTLVREILVKVLLAERETRILVVDIREVRVTHAAPRQEKDGTFFFLHDERERRKRGEKGKRV